MTVSAAVIAAICCTLALTVVLPVGLMLWLKKRGGKWTAFAVGAAVFLLFALVLEQAAHAAVLGSPLGDVFRKNIWLYALYGGLMAGLFEETGRFLAFRFLLRRQNQPVTALAYGAGHGGCEAFLVTGMTMINNLVLLRIPLDTLSPELAAAAQSLAGVPATLFLWAGFERIIAVIAHLGFSVLVFAAVRSGRYRLFLLALLLHAAGDFIAVTTNAMLSPAATELLVTAVTALTAVLAARVYKKMPVSAENT